MTKEKPPFDRSATNRTARARPPIDPDLLAAQALSFIAGDPDRLADFLGLTGLDPVSLRESAAAPGFARGILSYVMADEQLLVAFATELGLHPSAVEAAARMVQGYDEV